MTESRLQTLITVIPVISAGLYLLGFMYHVGYLDGFGIEDSIFPIATDRSLLFGFLAFLSFGLAPMLYALSAVILLFFAVLLAAVLSSTPRVKHLQTKVITKLRSWRFKIKNEPSPAINDLVDKSGTVYSYLAGSFFVVLMLGIVAILSSQSGKEQARKEIEAFKDKKGK